MTITGELFPRCALPGCANPTDTQGHPCGQCRRDLGPMLRHASHAVTTSSPARMNKNTQPEFPPGDFTYDV
ncbi:hypothetical protein WDY80_24530 (plasmid) [Gordonia hongkongensis]|uniref:hypothetical protein n=1 Tax=Gordonia hongkongensis TaxID=1701090 RepID=UPI0030D3A1CD